MQLLRNYWHKSKSYGDESIRESLGDIFPQIFIGDEYVPRGLPKEISEIIPSKERVERAAYILRKPSKYKLGEQDSVRLITGGNVLHSIYLENLLNEFETKLSQNLPESSWQTFFKKNMLVLNPGYIKLIPKANISPIDPTPIN